MKLSGQLVVAFLVSTSPLSAQVPADLSGRLLFRLGAADAGFESFHVERLADGGYRLEADVDLQVPGTRIIQHIRLKAGDRLEFREASVLASVNGDTIEVTLVREGEYGRQSQTQGGTTGSANLETPAHSILLTNNVLIHMAQFAWLHDGRLGETRDFTAFPKVPIAVVYEDERAVTKGRETLSVRRYYLNLADRIGAYVWLARDGTPLKISVPLQAFEAISEAHADWAELLVVTEAEPQGNSPQPSPYEEQEVTFESDSIVLAGTFSAPNGDGPWPAAVLISGSGAQDRDENTPGPGGLKLGIFRSIADTLTRSGIAVLRYDDRGVGGSGGSLLTAGLSDLVGDVAAAVTYLRARPDVLDDRIALVGHSEGAVIAPIVAADDERLAAIVCMAGTASPLDSVLMDQVAGAARAAGGDSAAVAEARASVAMLTEAIREGRDLDEVDLPAGLRALGGNEKWLREHIEHHPTATIQGVRASVLIVNGGQDVQIDPEHARRLGVALEEAGHTDSEVVIFPQLNHLFVVSRGEGTAEYADPNARVDREFLGYLSDWLTERVVH
jgi:alpha-beta hydrolase superfamily lysophospholipase